MGALLTNLLASLSKKLILVLALVATWILRTALPEQVAFWVAGMILGIGNYKDRLRYLRWYWTGDDPGVEATE
jgi:hypothetical protein